MGAGNLKESWRGGNSNHRGDSSMLEMLPKAGRGESSLAFPFLLSFSFQPLAAIGHFPCSHWQRSLGNVVCMGHPSPHSNFYMEQSREEKEISQRTNRYRMDTAPIFISPAQTSPLSFRFLLSIVHSTPPLGCLIVLT